MILFLLLILIPIALGFAVTLWIMFVPAYVIVNSQENVYVISQTGTFRISFCPSEAQFIEAKLFGITFSPHKNANIKKKIAAPQARHTVKKSMDAWILLFRGILKSFECKKFEFTVDTEDVVLNAKLIPIVMLIGGDSARRSVNFRRENEMNLILRCRINKILWAVIRFLTKK